MIRNKKPFTDRQLALLSSVRTKIQEIIAPNPDVIRHDRVEFYTQRTKKYGAIVKIKFPPRSTATRVKPE